MAIDLVQIKKLRQESGVSVADCRLALEESKGDYKKALEWLNAHGIEKAEKKHSLSEIEKIIKDYQKKTGFPNTKDFINFSGEAEMTKNLISNIPSFIHYNNRYYKLEKTDILELNAFFFYVIDTFMNALRKSYTGSFFPLAI